LQDAPSLRQAIQAATTAVDVAQLAARLGYAFSGEALLRLPGQKLARETTLL